MIYDYDPNENNDAEWLGDWQAPFGDAKFRMVLEPDGSADFNGVPGTWAYVDGKLVIVTHEGMAHQFAARLQGATLIMEITGLPDPLEFERVEAPAAKAEGIPDHTGANAAGLPGVREDAEGRQISLRADGTILARA